MSKKFTTTNEINFRAGFNDSPHYVSSQFSPLGVKIISPPTNKYDIVSKQSITILFYNYTGLSSPILTNQYSFPRSKTSILYQYVYKVKSSCRRHLTNGDNFQFTIIFHFHDFRTILRKKY
jgi:hypothetical protein